jgi:hypothetical protein
MTETADPPAGNTPESPAARRKMSDNAQTLGVLSISMLIVFFGLIPILMCFHIITPDKGPIESIGQRIFAFLMGMLFLFTGGIGLRIATVAIVTTHDPDKEKPFIIRWLRYIVSRPNRKTVAASALIYLTAFECFMAWRFNYSFPFGEGKNLIPLMGLEFIAVHSAAFLGIIAAVRVEGFWGRTIKYGIFLLFAALYVVGILHNMGWIPSLGFLFLLAIKYGGFYLNPPKENEKLILFSRWLINIMVFMGLAMVFKDGSLKTAANLPFGFAYFLVLATFEFLDLYSVTCKQEYLTVLTEKHEKRR